ncbi:unnamed protein product [Mytilus coruscus]|uniref:EGF-like domain-containing protein n=1 Tax=Mytilus coruscus TaxID=42192 RepID=A0A6J8DLW2_MYTCO|nr:unnamed protein product [Mytilus coruscus]
MGNYYAGHQLTCPQNITIHIDTAAGEVFNVSDFVSATLSDSELTFTFSPAELITLDHTAMVEQKKVVVTATDKWGAEDQCSFFVETKADACFKESFPVSVPNAAPVTCTSSNISCTVTCNSGFVFFDGNITKTYDCTGQNMWLPALPPDTCLKYEEPSYIIVLQVVYKTEGGFAKDCKSGHDEKIITNNASLTNDIYNICNIPNVVSAGPVVITNTQTITTGFDFRTSFTIKLPSTDLDQIKQKPTCGALLVNQLSKNDFFDYTGIVQCNSGTTTVVRQPSDSSNKVMSSGNQCDNGIKKMTTVDSSSKCIPCPPGTYSGSGDACNICPDGRFQSNFGQDECLDCLSNNLVPSEDKTTCLAVCPAGFISDDGLPTCTPCPEDHYWKNKTYCEPCPNSGNTLGKNAIPDVNGCNEPCDKGEYSVTGYAPCKKCPVNFYQDQTAQEMCTPCGNSSITQRSGSNDSSDCIQLGSNSLPGGSLCCDVCAGDEQCCSSATCSREASAITCENRCDDAYNNTLPCQCNSGCVAADNCCDDYQWKCIDPSLVCTGNADDCSGQGACTYKNNRRFCTCNLGYKGDNCEIELNPCDSSPCWNDGICTKIDSLNFNCTCPVDKLQRCIQETDRLCASCTAKLYKQVKNCNKTIRSRSIETNNSGEKNAADIPGACAANVFTSPKSIRLEIKSAPKTQKSRCCKTHKESRFFKIKALDVLQSSKQHEYFSRTDITDLLNDLRTIMTSSRLNFDIPALMTEENYNDLTGLSKDQFSDLLGYMSTVRSSGVRSVRTCLGVFLTKLRVGLSNKILGTVFGLKTSQVQRIIHAARRTLMETFIPHTLGFQHVSPGDFVTNHTTPVAKQLFTTDPRRAVIVLDGTYIYIQKSSDYHFQRMSYSMHKHRPLVKPLIIVGTDGYILSILGPYFADGHNNDASITKHAITNNLENITAWLQDDDICIVDRGFRDAVQYLEDQGYMIKMPVCLVKGKK